MKDILIARNVTRLLHFTRAENLENIMKYGLMPREDLEDRVLNIRYNDDYRLDNRLDAVCMSIEFPNYKMFYKLRQKNPGIDWVVLCLDAVVLCEYPCTFSWTNAGDANARISLSDSADKFEELFLDRSGYPRRKELGIPEKYPTNPQAEVLVFGRIPVKYINGIYFENQRTLSKYSHILTQTTNTMVLYDYFLPRSDWKLWK